MVGAFLITLTALVFTVSLNYYISNQSNQNSVPTLLPTPTPTLTPTPNITPTPTPKPTPIEGSPANLVINAKGLDFTTDGGLVLLVYADIENTGDNTAYNVSLHIQTWFSDGSKGIDEIVRINSEIYRFWIFSELNILGGETYSLRSRWHGALAYRVPGIFWLDGKGEVYPYDLISSYVVTPLWDDTP